MCAADGTATQTQTQRVPTKTFPYRTNFLPHLPSAAAAQQRQGEYASKVFPVQSSAVGPCVILYKCTHANRHTQTSTNHRLGQCATARTKPDRCWFGAVDTPQSLTDIPYLKIARESRKTDDRGGMDEKCQTNRWQMRLFTHTKYKYHESTFLCLK